MEDDVQASLWTVVSDSEGHNGQALHVLHPPYRVGVFLWESQNVGVLEETFWDQVWMNVDPCLTMVSDDEWMCGQNV